MHPENPQIDRLDALLKRFSMRARLFHTGLLCGTHDFDYGSVGYLHLVRSGNLQVRQAGQAPREIGEPTLLFYPLPLAHQFVADPSLGADMSCASVRFAGGAQHPIARALPACLIMPLSKLPNLATSSALLFSEASGAKCGRAALLDRLFEVILIQLLRELMEQGGVDTGLMAGLAHPQLSKALVAIHERPEQPWTLASLAACAGHSRSRFAEVFHHTLGITVGDYLSDFRVTVAQDLLKRGRSLKVVAEQVGYGSALSLARAFKAKLGVTPRAWLGSSA